MSIAKSYTFEGRKFNLTTKDRVSAALAHNAGYQRTIEAKAADYTITANDMGKILTNRGASGTVTFTLPDAGLDYKGAHLTILPIVAQKTTIATATSDVLITSGDVDADSVTQNSAAIGGMIELFCDGTSWIAVPLGNTAGGTNAIRYDVTD